MAAGGAASFYARGGSSHIAPRQRDDLPPQRQRASFAAGGCSSVGAGTRSHELDFEVCKKDSKTYEISGGRLCQE